MPSPIHDAAERIALDACETGMRARSPPAANSHARVNVEKYAVAGLLVDA